MSQIRAASIARLILPRNSRKAGVTRGLATRVINDVHQPDTYTAPELNSRDNSCGEVSAAHWDDQWSRDAITKGVEDNVVMTWGAGDAMKAMAPMFVRSEGIYLYDEDDKEYMDWTCQAICTNLGYTVPEAVQKAVSDQLRDLPMVYGGLAMCPIRARLASLMAELCPADINGFLFPSGGNEANEAAIRMARRYTGKHKVLSRYRSYHGGSTSTLTMTGDFRRWFGETGTAGFVKMFDPNPKLFAWGEDDAEITANCLAALEEQIMYEGPGTIAAIFMVGG